MKRVLMIAYAFPPLNFSGTARPFYFAKYLPLHGFQPVILTREGTGRRKADPNMLSALPACVEVHRTRTGTGDDWMGWFRKHMGFLDRLLAGFPGVGGRSIAEAIGWRLDLGVPGLRGAVHWCWPVVAAGLRLWIQGGFDLIWATGDPWSSLKAGYWLSRITGRPLVADIRDPMTYGALWRPWSKASAAWLRQWEYRILSSAEAVVYTSPLTTAFMRGRVSSHTGRKIRTITNGFDRRNVSSHRSTGKRVCVFKFVGHLSRYHRRPDVLFEGLRLARRDPGVAQHVVLQFVGGMDGFENQIGSEGLKGSVEYLGYVLQQDARQHMEEADVLVLLQTLEGPGRDVVSGKGYEYLAAQKPILAIVPPDGGDAWLLRQAKAGIMAAPNDPERVAQCIRQCVGLWRAGALDSLQPKADISKFSRRCLTESLANLFREVLKQRDAR